MSEELINAILKVIGWTVSVLVVGLLLAAVMFRRYRTIVNQDQGPQILGEPRMTLIIKNDHPAFGIIVTPPVVRDAEQELIPIDTAIESTSGNQLQIIRDENDPNKASVVVGSSGDASIFVRFATKAGQVLKVLSQSFHITHGDPGQIEGGTLNFIGLDAVSDEPPAPVETAAPAGESTGSGEGEGGGDSETTNASGSESDAGEQTNEPTAEVPAGTTAPSTETEAAELPADSPAPTTSTETASTDGTV